MENVYAQEPKTVFQVIRINGTLGAEVSGISLSDDIDEQAVEALSAALVEHKVLFFRNQNLTTAQHLAFGRKFGPLEVHPFTQLKSFRTVADHPEIIVVESEAGSRSSASHWHSDVSWRHTPSLGSILRCTIVPAYGGDTLWADMTAVYEGLDDAMRSLLSGLVAVHDWHAFRRALSNEGLAPSAVADLQRQFPLAEHPVVRTHPVSGKKLIYVNCSFTVNIKGMSDTESKLLLERLYQETHRPEYQVRFRWSIGDVAFWDNRSTQHYAVADFGDQHRRMERVTIAGDRPF